jgi:hypothetical protein
MERAHTTTLLASLGAELVLLQRLTHHRTGDWSEGSTQAFLALSALAALPYVAAFAALALRARRHAMKAAVWPFVVALAGLPFPLLALADYGHATAGLLFLGWSAQWMALLVGLSTSWLAGRARSASISTTVKRERAE